MFKTTLYLPNALKSELTRLARETGRSEAALIRQALTAFVEGEHRPRPTLPLFRSGDPTLAEHVDEALSGFGS